jgi:hypothetical protein
MIYFSTRGFFQVLGATKHLGWGVGYKKRFLDCEKSHVDRILPPTVSLNKMAKTRGQISLGIRAQRPVSIWGSFQVLEMKCRIPEAYSAIPAVGKGGNVGLQVKGTALSPLRLLLGLINNIHTLNQAQKHNPYSFPSYKILGTT